MFGQTALFPEVLPTIPAKKKKIKKLAHEKNKVDFTWNCIQCSEILAGAKFELIFGNGFKFFKFKPLNSLNSLNSLNLICFTVITIFFLSLDKFVFKTLVLHGTMQVATQGSKLIKSSFFVFKFILKFFFEHLDFNLFL